MGTEQHGAVPPDEARQNGPEPDGGDHPAAPATPAGTQGAPADEVPVELNPVEAAAGTIRGIAVPPGDHSVTVRLPAGIADGATIRLPGAGRPDPAGGPPRDLVLRVQVTDAHPAPPPPGAPGSPYPPPGPPAGVGAPGPPYPQPAYPQPGWPAYPGGPVAPTPPGGRGRAKLISAVAVGLAVVVVAGCCGLSRLVVGGDDPDDGPTAGGGPSVTASPTAAPASPEQYRAALAEVDAALVTSIGIMTSADTPTTVHKTATDLSLAVETASAKLAGITPPDRAVEQHEALVAALDELAAAAADTAAAAEGREVCAGSSAAALFSRADAAGAVRSAAADLAAADPAQAYRVGSFLPAQTADSNRRLKNGSYVKRTRGGMGHLRIDNGSSGDSVITMVKKGGSKAVVTVYVRGKAEHTVTGVRDGTYEIYMASGQDWDSKAGRFTRNCSFSQFDDSFKFRTTASQYTIWEVTLTPVAGGNASTSGVDPDQFPR